MANVRKLPTGRWQLTLTSKLLPKGRVWLSFDTEADASTYGQQADKWFAAGVVPPGLLQPAVGERKALLGPVIRAWLATGNASAADQEVLQRLFVEVGAVEFKAFNYDWCERWVRGMKLERQPNLSPGSIRKRVQALTRAIDWHLRKTPDAMVGNPLHLLPRGYSTYNARDAELALAMGKAPKVDQERDRRLTPDEEQRVMQALQGTKAEGRERALQVDPQFIMLFRLILGTGMRLREAYRLTEPQIDLPARVVRPQASKTWHGRVKHRAIPLAPQLHRELAAYLVQRRGQGRAGLIFDFWDGEAATLKQVTNRLSARFTSLFRYAGLDDFTEHDLRHEATCRWYEMRQPAGGWMYRDEEINRIMGWAPNSKMGQRYASFRAEDLAGRMWPGKAA